MALTEEQMINRAAAKGFLVKHWKGTLAAVVLVFLLLGAYGFFVDNYNQFVMWEQDVEKSWSNVEVFYQQRYDLITSLIETVKGAKGFEQSTLIEITQARSAWTGAKKSEDKVKAATSLDTALSRLLFVVENYPDLKSNENFLSLQEQLTIIENQVSSKRMEYNAMVADYNIVVSTFPSNLAARWFGFEKKPFFEAKVGEEAPNVGF